MKSDKSITLECISCKALIRMPMEQFIEREQINPVKCNCSTPLESVRITSPGSTKWETE